MFNPNRILVSEDTPLWQGIFSRLLKSKGYDVIQSLDLTSTVESLNKYFFNVAICDLALDPKDESRLDGIETMKAIVRLDEGTQAIVLTGKGTIELAVSALKDFHVHHFLEKEKFNEGQFMEILENACIQAYRSAQAPGRFAPPETLVAPVDWHRTASHLELSRIDLEAMFYALIRAAMPITFKGQSLLPQLDPTTSSFTTECWSKWYGRGIAVRIGKRGQLALPDPSVILETRELGKMCGILISSDKDRSEYI